MTRSELNSIVTPEQTRTYKPITTKLIFDTIDGLSRETGLSIKNEILEAKQKGQLQKMRFQFDTGNPKFSFEIALMNSYNKTISLRAGSGSVATICWNTQVFAPFKIQEKHMGNVQEDLYEFLKDSFAVQKSQITNANTLWNAFDYVPLTRREMAELAGVMFFEEKLFKPTQADTIIKELEKPSFQYDYNPESLNELYQACTYAIQTVYPTEYLETQQNVQSFFIDTYQEITQNKLLLV